MRGSPGGQHDENPYVAGGGIPLHVGIIPDGNRRWASKSGLPLWLAYWAGYTRLVEVSRLLFDFGVRRLTVYVLSRENCLARGDEERGIVYKLLSRAVDALRDDLMERRVAFTVAGDLDLLPPRLRERLIDLEAESERWGTRGVFLAGVCYSVDWELKARCEGGLSKALEESPPIDLVVRSGGFRRLSGFFPLLTTYSELYFIDKLWPDVTTGDFIGAIEWYSRQKRNFGR